MALIKSGVCIIILAFNFVFLAHSFDPCLLSPCGPQKLCISQGQNTFNCIDERNLVNSNRFNNARKLSATKREEDDDEYVDTVFEGAMPEDSEDKVKSPTEKRVKVKAKTTVKPGSKSAAKTSTKTPAKNENKISDDEKQLNMINMPKDFSKEYLGFDPCLSSPCLFGKICKTMQGAQTGYLCLNELDETKEISDARNVYKNMELLAKEAVIMNINTIASRNPMIDGFPVSFSNNFGNPMIAGTQNGFTFNLKAKKLSKSSNPCANNPCKEDEKCQVKSESVNGFVCIKNERNQVAQLLNDDKFINETGKRCKNAHSNDRLEIEVSQKFFIVCLEEEDFTIMECPDDLLFNKFLQRCDYHANPVSMGCGSSPCHFGGKCIDLANGEYKCECPAGFSGINCEKASDVCESMNPCGPNGVCHTLRDDSPIPYYCTCFSERAFGLNCDDDGKLERNPCDDVESAQALFPSRISDSVFVHCDSRNFSLKYCQKGMRFSTNDALCKWIDLAKRN